MSPLEGARPPARRGSLVRDEAVSALCSKGESVRNRRMPRLCVSPMSPWRTPTCRSRVRQHLDQLNEGLAGPFPHEHSGCRKTVIGDRGGAASQHHLEQAAEGGVTAPHEKATVTKVWPSARQL